MARARITGNGSTVPDRTLSNLELDWMVDTSDEWITTRTGIKARRIASDSDYTSTLATPPAQNALALADIDRAEFELIVVATVTPDFPFPATACLVQNNLKAVKAAAFAISAACSDFNLQPSALTPE